MEGLASLALGPFISSMKHEDFNGFWVSEKCGTPAMSSLNKTWFLISGVGGFAEKIRETTCHLETCEINPGHTIMID